ncbi:MAG: ABC transporter substrate-binding protein [Planctomycetota bacterium]|nr:ABC transporter substrate-binding protein [Planctomycetota bacterium]
MDREITIAHSPDADDAFMFYALAKEKVRREGLRVRHVMADIESLNRSAEEGRYEITAISYHAYAYLQDRYRILPVGSSLGEGCGPLVVGARAAVPEELAGKRIAIPGEKTTAHLALRLFQPEFEPVFVHFDRVGKSVLEGETDFGVLIHEGQVTYEDEGLFKVIDLGEWWLEETDLPLPLGANAIRRDLSGEDACMMTGLIRESIQYALDHREEALSYALDFGRGVDQDRGDRFVEMYVNPYTIDLGEKGKRAVASLLGRAHEKGLIPNAPLLDF